MPRGSASASSVIVRGGDGVAVEVAEAAAGGDLVANALLQRAHVGKTAVGAAVPDQGVADADLEDAAGAGDERDRAELVGEGLEQLLGPSRRPGAASCTACSRRWRRPACQDSP